MFRDPQIHTVTMSAKMHMRQAYAGGDDVKQAYCKHMCCILLMECSPASVPERGLS